MASDGLTMRSLAILLVAVLLGGTPLECDQGTRGSTLSGEKARQVAQKELASRLAVQPDAYRTAAAGASAADPFLVERLDGSEECYYLVPFRREGETTLVVMLDSRRGDFLGMSYLRQPGPYLPLDEPEARRLLLDWLDSTADRQIAQQSKSSLVWQPSQQTQSRYEPLWRFEAAGRSWFVDQTGGVWNRIEEPRLKGGVPPDS
jgi:hypothetical protein